MADLGKVNEKLRVRRGKRDKAKRELAAHRRAIRKLNEIRSRLLAGTMHVSDAGVKFIADFEGFYPEPYNDPVGHATVGYGHLLHLGNVTAADRKAVWVEGQVTPGKLTKAEGRTLLKKDLADAYEPAAHVLFKKGGPLYGLFTQARFDALVSLAFNLGAGALTPKPHPGFETLGRALQNGDLTAIPASFALYDKAGGKALPGLTRRRTAEARLFRTGVYSTN